MNRIIFLITFISLSLPPLFSFSQAVTISDVAAIPVLYEQGQKDRAIYLLDSLQKKVSRNDSFFVMLEYARAEIDGRESNFEAAIKDYKELIKLLPFENVKEADLQTQVAIYDKYIGDFEDAFVAYKRILEIDPSYDITFGNYASALNSAGKYREAINVLNSNPNRERPILEYYHYAVAYCNLGKNDSAKTNIDNYLTAEESRNDESAYKYAAQIYSALGDKKKACEFISRAMEIQTKDDLEIKFNSLPDRVKSYFIFKYKLKEFDEIKKLHSQLCN